MKERPILFSGEMVKAILEGRKTMTRRLGTGYHREVGDRLWVRETFKLVPETAYRSSEGVWQTINPSDPHEAAIYKCGWERSPGSGPWKPSISMPRWASRITLEITDTRVEELQDITEEDAIAEGVCEYCSSCKALYEDDRNCEFNGYECESHGKALKEFKNLWDSINGKKPDKAWDDNPWVWVIEFKEAKS